MDLNEDLWKQRARGPQLATNVHTISLNKKIRDAPYGYVEFSKYIYGSGHYAVVGSLEYVASEEDCRAVSNFTIGKVVIVAVNGNKTKEYASQDIVRKKIATYESRGQNNTLSLRREEDLMFSFLPLVIELGLDRVLRFLVEENGADPNLCIGFRLSQGAKPNTSILAENVRYNGPMIYCAACQRDSACAKYLLSVVDSIPDSSLGRPGRSPVPLLVHATRQSPSPETFQAILDHPYVRTHQIDGTETSFAPLQVLCAVAFEGDLLDITDLIVEKIGSLLKAGADPAPHDGAPVAFARSKFSDLLEKDCSGSGISNTEEGKAIERLRKVLSMMEMAANKK